MKYILKNIKDYSNLEIKNFYNKIPTYKKNKIKKLLRFNIKKSSIIAEIILEQLLLNENIKYDNVTFYTINNKPFIKNYNLFYSISHSYDYIITAISKTLIGIDIQKIRKTSLNVINQFATDNEKKYILSSKKNIEKRLYQIYTLKESYIKMNGLTMNNALDVEFSITNDEISCSDKTVSAKFIYDLDNYIISYCTKNE